MFFTSRDRGQIAAAIQRAKEELQSEMTFEIDKGDMKTIEKLNHHHRSEQAVWDSISKRITKLEHQFEIIIKLLEVDKSKGNK